MSRKFHREDLVDVAIRLRKAKEEVANIAIFLSLGEGFDTETDKLKTQITAACEVINLIDDRIVATDYPKQVKK